MPSIKNNCSDCPIKLIIPEDYGCYSVDDNLKLQQDIVGSVLYSAGIEGGRRSASAIDAIAKQCIDRVLSDECVMYILKNDRFAFKANKGA